MKQHPTETDSTENTVADYPEHKRDIDESMTKQEQS
jgi:hypothetical protein